MSQPQSIQRVAVIMAGGSGERFWPVSRRLRPKQLLRLTREDQTMLGEAVERISPLIAADHVYIVTGEHLVEPIRTANVGIPDANVIAEPDKRNTAGALAYAAAHLVAKYGGDGSLLSMAVLTADHVIGDEDLFRQTVDRAMGAAESHDCLAVLGVQPTRPETGYGYIQIRDDVIEPAKDGLPIYAVSAFHEKPSAQRAQDFISEGNYYWNSGMFFWKADTFARELETARPEMAEALGKMTQALREADGLTVRAAFESLESISIDYALMEHAKHVLLVPATFPWDDVGAWTSLDRTFTPDENQNVTVGDPVVVDSSDCIVYNEAGADKMAVAVIGAEHLTVVVTEDAVLVVPKDRAQDVRRAVDELRERGAKQV
jgi:mannose-1-phosphate guanylyltransferase